MYKRYIKRILDIAISFLAIILLSPLYLIIGIAIKVIDKENIFYKQDRTGENGNNFKIYKFKTMKNGNETKLGRFLRSTSLDELPQFYNVLKSDMSIVGPRPWIPVYYENFNDMQKRRLEVKPGIVGLAQVNGRRSINIYEKIDYDIKYVENLNFFLDIKILVQSFKVIIVKEDIENSDEYIENEIELLKKTSRQSKLISDENHGDWVFDLYS